VDPVPDPLLLRKSGIAGNLARTSGSVARNSDHRGGQDKYVSRFIKIGSCIQTVTEGIKRQKQQGDFVILLPIFFFFKIRKVG
jgi:hypothetical protein